MRIPAPKAVSLQETGPFRSYLAVEYLNFHDFDAFKAAMNAGISEVKVQPSSGDVKSYVTLLVVQGLQTKDRVERMALSEAEWQSMLACVDFCECKANLAPAKHRPVPCPITGLADSGTHRSKPKTAGGMPESCPDTLSIEMRKGNFYDRRT